MHSRHWSRAQGGFLEKCGYSNWPSYGRLRHCRVDGPAGKIEVGGLTLHSTTICPLSLIKWLTEEGGVLT